MSAGTAILRAAIRSHKDEYERLVNCRAKNGNKDKSEIDKALKTLGVKIKGIEEDLKVLEEVNMIYTENWMLQKQKVKYGQNK